MHSPARPEQAGRERRGRRFDRLMAGIVREVLCGLVVVVISALLG